MSFGSFVVLRDFGVGGAESSWRSWDECVFGKVFEIEEKFNGVG